MSLRRKFAPSVLLFLSISCGDAGREAASTAATDQESSMQQRLNKYTTFRLEADLSALLIPLINSSVEKGMQRNFNRMAKLTMMAAAESAMAHDLTTMLLLQTVRQEAVRYPEDFEARMPVSLDKKETLDARIRALYNQMRRLARQRQRRLLKQPLRDLLTQLDGHSLDIVAVDEEGGDE